jgi:hypothetical protein
LEKHNDDFTDLVHNMAWEYMLYKRPDVYQIMPFFIQNAIDDARSCIHRSLLTCQLRLIAMRCIYKSCLTPLKCCVMSHLKIKDKKEHKKIKV